MSNNLFAIQYLGFDGPDLFTSQLSAQQQAQIYGRVLDLDFQRKAEVVPALQQQLKQTYYFADNQLTFIKRAQPADDQVQLNTNAITAYQQDNEAPDAAQSAAYYAKQYGLNGINSGNKTVQIVQAALAIASRVNEAQLRESGVGDGVKNPGVIKSTFQKPPFDVNAPKFVGKLGKFIDPVSLRESLIDYGISNSTGQFDPEIIGAQQLDMIQPGNNLTAEASLVRDSSVRKIMARAKVTANIRFQRTAPHYSRAVSNTPMDLIRTIGWQEKLKNGFKPPAADRFPMK